VANGFSRGPYYIYKQSDRQINSKVIGRNAATQQYRDAFEGVIQDDKERNFVDAAAQRTVDNILIVKTCNLFERFDSLGVAFWATGSSRLRLGQTAFVVNKAE